MPRTDWQNENSGRSYPFVVDPALWEDGVSLSPTPDFLLPKTTILDAGFFLGPEADAVADAEVYLSKIVRGDTGTTSFEFHFKMRVSGGWDHSFVFTRAEDEDDGFCDYADAVTDPGGDLAQAAGQAFLVTGSMADLLDVTSPDTEYEPIDESSNVEPALIQSDNLSRVTSITTANDPDVEFPSCLSDGYSEVPPIPEDVIVVKRDLVGDVKFKPGHNATIEVREARNRMTFGATIGAGEGVPCSDIPRDPDESGQPEPCTCEEIISFVNGVSPSPNGNFNIQSGKGVSVRVDPNNPHRVIVSLDSNVVLQVC